MLFLEIAFWICAFCIVYTYLLYPFVLISISGFVQVLRDTANVFEKRDRRQEVGQDLPKLAVVIAAFNEEKHIKERIENLFQQEYPSDKVKIYIGSDGSDDKTVEIVQAIQDTRLQFFPFTERRGKVAVINDLISRVEEEVIVLSDANTFFKPNALAMLMRHFDDSSVGGVVGELELVDAATHTNKDGIYWRIERVLKFHEARLGALLGANGAIYALRRALYEPLPTDTIVDDFTVIFRISQRRWQVKYDPQAIAQEEIPPNLEDEYNRRVRIGAGNYQAFFRFLSVLNPRFGWLWFTYLSHKVLRWFVPHFMVAALAINGALLNEPLYQVTFILQLLIYAVASVGYVAMKKVSLPMPIALLVFLVNMNVAFAHGFFRYLSNSGKGTWKRTAR